MEFKTCKKEGIAKELTKGLFYCTLGKDKRCPEQFDFGGRVFCKTPIAEKIIHDRAKKDEKRENDGC